MIDSFIHPCITDYTTKNTIQTKKIRETCEKPIDRERQRQSTYRETFIETEGQRQIDRDRQRQTARQRQTDRQRQSETDSETETDRQRQRQNISTDIHG